VPQTQEGCKQHTNRGRLRLKDRGKRQGDVSIVFFGCFPKGNSVHIAFRGYGKYRLGAVYVA